MSNDSSENFIVKDEIKTQTSLMQLFRHLWPYFIKQKTLLSVILFVVFGLASVGRVLPRLIGYAIDEGITKGSAEVLTKVAILFLVFEILSVLFNFLNNYLFSVFGNKMIAMIRHDLMKKFYLLPLDYFNKNPNGRIINRLTHDVNSLAELFSEGLVSVFVQSVVLVSIAIAMFFIAPMMTLFTICSAPLFVYASLKLTTKIRFALQEQKRSFAEVNSFMTETLNGLRIVQIFNSELRQIEKFKTAYHDYSEKSFLSLRSFAMMQPLMNLMSASLVTAALLAGGFAAVNKWLALGSIVSFVLYAQDIVAPLREILDRWQGFQNSLSSADRVFQFLHETEEIDHGQITPKIWAPVQFKDLSFQYNQALPFVLQGISLRLERGNSLALVGRSGCGKTTLTSLLQRLYCPERGQCFIGDVDINDIPLQELRTNVGLIQQDNFIFKGSVRQNVNLLKYHITDEAIQSALEQVGLWGILQAQGRDLDFELEEKGLNLSAGERQLLAFSRILVTNPEVLILDEATASVDSKTERLIQSAINLITKNRTSIIVAHRLSTIEKCDLIVAMQEGRIVEQGSHQELMKAKGYYYQLAEAGLKSTAITASAAGTREP